MEPIPDDPDWRAAAKSWEDNGWMVHGICDWCQWGFVVSRPDTPEARYCCAYGQCEAAPG